MKRQAVRRTSAFTVALASLASVAARAADLQAVNQATQAARSASGASAVVTGSAVPSLGFGAVLQTVLGLVLVIAVVFACGWLARRFGLQHGPRNALIRTVGGASLGGKERVAVVEIGDTWLVLGASPGSVTLLHTLPAGELPNAAHVAQAAGASAGGSALQGSFGQRFRDALKHEAGKRFNPRSKGHDGGAQ